MHAITPGHQYLCLWHCYRVASPLFSNEDKEKLRHKVVKAPWLHHGVLLLVIIEAVQAQWLRPA